MKTPGLKLGVEIFRVEMSCDPCTHGVIDAISAVFSYIGCCQDSSSTRRERKSGALRYFDFPFYFTHNVIFHQRKDLGIITKPLKCDCT